MVKVYVDDREKSSKVPTYLKGMGLTVIYKHLPIGDYIPAEGVIVERKRVDDLAHSVFEGRFFDQVRRLKESGGRTVLIVEGGMDFLHRVTNRYRAVEAALIMATVVNSIPVIYTGNAKHTAEVIKYLAEKLQRPSRKRPVLPTYRKVQKPRDVNYSEWQIYVLSSFPGIGPKLAERLLKKFGSLRAVIDSAPSELARVEGMSEEKALTVFKVANSRFTEVRKGKDLSRFMDG